MNEVTNPTHYNAPERKECIIEMFEIYGREAVINFCELNAYKYEYRKDLKSQKDSDIQKAQFYRDVASYLYEGLSIHEALQKTRQQK